MELHQRIASPFRRVGSKRVSVAFCRRGNGWSPLSRLVMVAILVTLGVNPVSADEPPSIFELVDKLLDVKQFEAEVERQHNELFSIITELDRQRKATARTERQEIEVAIQQLELQIQQKQWALTFFEPGLRNRLPEAENIPSTMRRWERNRKVWKKKFLEFPDLAHGEIRSGRALNFFLTLCGPSAIDHEMFLEQLTQMDHMQSLQNAPSLNQPGLQNPHQASDSIAVRRALIEEVSGPNVFTADDLRNIYVQIGLTGGKLRIRLDGEVLPLEWPHLLRLDEDYAKACEAIEDSKSRAFEHLRDKGETIPLELQRRLMMETDRLCSQFARKQKVYFDELREAVKNHGRAPRSSEASNWVTAKLFLKELRGGVSRFVAQSPGDVRVDISDQLGESFNIRQILAAVAQQGARFASGDKQAEPVYVRLMEQMSRYYVDLYAMSLAAESEEKQRDLANDEVERLMQVEFEKYATPGTTNINPLNISNGSF